MSFSGRDARVKGGNSKKRENLRERGSSLWLLFAIRARASGPLESILNGALPKSLGIIKNVKSGILGLLLLL